MKVQHPTNDGEKQAATTITLDETELAGLVADTTMTDEELRELGVLDQVEAARAKAAGVQAEPEPKAEKAEGEKPAEQDELADDPEGAAGPKGAREAHIPRSRFDKVNGRRKEAETRAEQLERELADLKTMMARGDKPTAKAEEPAAPVEDEPIDPKASINQQLDALRDDYDEGKIEGKLYEQQRRTLEKELYRLELQEEGLLGQGPVDVRQVAEQVEFAQLTRQLDADNAHWLSAVKPTEFSFLVAEAQARFEDENGHAPRTEAEAYEARLIAIEVAKEYRFDQRGKAPEPAKASTQPSPAPTAGISAKAAIEARREKVELAKHQPPDIRTAPKAASDFEPSDEALEKMTERELLALPPSVRARVNARLGSPEPPPPGHYNG